MGSFPQKLGEWRKYSLIPRSRGMRGNGGNGAVIRGWAKNGRNGRKTAEKRPERSKTVTKRSQLHKTAGKRLNVVASAPKWPLSSCIQHLAGKKQSKNDRKRSENGSKWSKRSHRSHRSNSPLHSFPYSRFGKQRNHSHSRPSGNGRGRE